MTMRQNLTRKRKTHFATITVWAALMAAASMLPSFPILGGGGNFSISYTLAPLAGVMFGAIPGGLAALIGDFIGTLIAPHTANVGIFTCLTGASNAFAAGYLSRGNWKPAFGLIVLSIGSWLLYPAAREAWIYSVTVWCVGLVMALVGGTLGVYLFEKKRFLWKAIGLFLILYPCYIVAQGINCIFVMMLMDLPADLLKVLAFSVPAERLVFSFAAVIIGIPLLMGLPKIGVFVGPAYDNLEEETELDRQMRLEYEENRRKRDAMQKECAEKVFCQEEVRS